MPVVQPVLGTVTNVYINIYVIYDHSGKIKRERERERERERTSKQTNNNNPPPPPKKKKKKKKKKKRRAQELCKSRGGRPGPPRSLIVLSVSVDVKQH